MPITILPCGSSSTLTQLLHILWQHNSPKRPGTTGAGGFLSLGSLVIGNPWPMSPGALWLCATGTVTPSSHQIVSANRTLRQPPVTHIRYLWRCTSHPTFSLPYLFISLFTHSVHYYESTSVSPFLTCCFLLACLCCHWTRC